MRVLIPQIGSRGDLQPFTALAQAQEEILAAGRDVDLVVIPASSAAWKRPFA